MKKILFCIVITTNMLVLGYCQQTIIFRPMTQYAKRFIANDTIPFQSINYKSFRIYFKDSSYAATHLQNIETDIDTAYNRILSVLKVSHYDNGINLIAVDSKDAMQKLMGYKIKGGAACGQDLVFFVYNQTIRPQFKHEIFHLISFEIWGATTSRLLDEGGATYTDNFCFYENPMYSINAYFLQHNELFSFTSLINDFDKKAQENDVIAYIQSAGIFKYLYEKYGIEKIELLRTKGFENFESIYGFSIEQLESNWLTFIKTILPPKDIDEKKLMDQGCG